MNENKNVKEFLRSQSGGFVLIIITYVAYFLLMSLLGALLGNADTGTFGSILCLIVVVAWGVLGWRALSMIQPSIFLIMPIAGWLLYFAIKGILSVIVGIFVAPYQIAKIIKGKI